MFFTFKTNATWEEGGGAVVPAQPLDATGCVFVYFGVFVFKNLNTQIHEEEGLYLPKMKYKYM